MVAIRLRAAGPTQVVVVDSGVLQYLRNRLRVTECVGFEAHRRGFCTEFRLDELASVQQGTIPLLACHNVLVSLNPGVRSDLPLPAVNSLAHLVDQFWCMFGHHIVGRGRILV